MQKIQEDTPESFPRNASHDSEIDPSLFVGQCSTASLSCIIDESRPMADFVDFLNKIDLVKEAVVGVLAVKFLVQNTEGLGVQTVMEVSNSQSRQSVHKQGKLTRNES